MKKGTTTDRSTVNDVLDRADVLWLALSDEDGPYCVPVNHARSGDVLYIHSGLKGRKADILRTGSVVAFSAATDLVFKPATEHACSMGYRFRSVCGTATPEELSGDAFMHALDALTLKYGGEAMPYHEKGLTITTTFALTIKDATARTKE